jgi:hypothetical protein
VTFTNGGKDMVASQVANTSTQAAACNYIALTADSAAASASDTTLASEIATAGGALVRAQGAYAHTGGTNTLTVSKTFTANGSDALPVTVAKYGLFNASSSGTMGWESKFGTSATLSAVGDQLTVTATITLS